MTENEQGLQIATRAAELAVEIAWDNSHGYLWGGNGPVDFDCSGLVNYVYEKAGVHVNAEVRNTTQTAPIYYLKHGFVDVTGKVNLKTGAGLRIGDVPVNKKNHMVIYVGDGRIVQARSNLDGKTGDSSGQEIRVQAYYDYPWDCVLRYVGTGGSSEAPKTDPSDSGGGFSLQFRVLEYGSKGEDVRAVQRNLKALGFEIGRYGTDGEFGRDTKQAVIAYQKSVGLDADGVVGPATMAVLTGVNA